MKLWKKIGLCSISFFVALSLSACGNHQKTSNNSSDTKVITLWGDSNRVQFYKTMVKGFQKRYPKIKVRVTMSPDGSAGSMRDVGKDPSKAADVFQVPHDQLGQLADEGYINPLGPKEVNNIKNKDTLVGYQAVNWKGKEWGYPFGLQAAAIYYNKKKLNQSDLKKWETLTQHGVVGMDFTNSYYSWPIFFSAGTKLFGNNGQELNGSTFASSKGVNALKWIQEQGKNKGVMQTKNFVHVMKNTSASAIVDGPWDYQNLRKVLGKDLGVAPMPSTKVGGKEVPMRVFLGIQCLAINSASKHQKEDQLLASYLSNKESQTTVWKNSGEIPINKEALKNKEITNSDEAKALDIMARPDRSVVMPKMPQMSIFWDNASPLTSGVFDGKVKSNEFMAKLVRLQKMIEKKI